MAFIYEIDGNILFSDLTPEPIGLADCFVSMVIENDYDNNVFPVIRLKLRLNAVAITRIQNDDNAKLNISLKKTILTEDMNNSVYNYHFKNENFLFIDKDEIPLAEELTDKSSSLFDIEFKIISETDLINNKKIVNGNLIDTDIEGAIQFLTSKMSNKPIVFEPPNNAKIYDQIILPPNNIIRSVKYIDTVYGIYKNGTRIFFDIPAYYIMNKLGNKDLPTLKDNFKNTQISIYFDDDANSAFNGIDDSEDGEGAYYRGFANISDVAIVNYSNSKSEFIGSDCVVMGQNIDGTYKNKFNTSENHTKTRIFQNRYNNKMKEIEIIERGLKGNFIKISLENMDLSGLACDKNFILTFYNKLYAKFNGLYHIMKVTTILEGLAGSSQPRATATSMLYLIKVETDKG